MDTVTDRPQQGKDLGAIRMRRGAALVPALLCAGLASGSFAATQAGAKNAATAFYAGKVLTLVVPYGAAGGYEYWAAALKPYLEKALGVARIDIVNKTGGGGIVGANYVYTANPDGLTIGEVNGIGSIFAQIGKKPGVAFDMRKFSWIGSPDVETTVTVARSAGRFKSFGDLWRLRGGQKKIVALSAGYGGSNYVGTAIPLSSFGIPYRMLLAYQGSSAVKAGLLRGDGDLASYGYPVFRPVIQSHNVVPLFVSAEKPLAALPKVPTIVDLAKKYKLPQAKISLLDAFSRAVNMGKDFAAPPGVPAGRLAFLRAAFKKAAESDGFVATTKKAGRVSGYTSPQSLKATVAAVIKNKADFAPFLKR